MKSTTPNDSPDPLRKHPELRRRLRDRMARKRLADRVTPGLPVDADPVETRVPTPRVGALMDDLLGDLLKEVAPQDFIKFGLIPEFIGRVPVSVSLEGLDVDALIRIIKEPKNAMVKQYKKLFELDDVELEFEEDAIREIAEEAYERKTGARGIRSIMEKVMMDVMFEIPSDDTIEKCIITKDAVLKKTKPIVIHKGEADKDKKAKKRA